jgi:adenylate cyclase
VKTTGDGILIEFPSVVEAVACAVEVQRGMVERNIELPKEQTIEFRVGINLGDVIVEGDDIFGDGVNIAARLEALAEPGGICISRTVRDQIRDKLPFAFEDLGEQSMHNIARPVRAFSISVDAVAALPGFNDQLPLPTVPEPMPLSTPRLSIVVLPFANLSSDPDQQYFADGITEDLTTDLSRIEGMFVISRNTAFTYHGKVVDAKQVGRELGVRYVLEGSVRKLGERVRINAQLIDAKTAAHLWAERFDRDTRDLFGLQDEITSRIAIELNIELLVAEASRSIERPDAFDTVLRGRAVMWRPPTLEKYAEAVDLFERALAIDPGSLEARSWLAIALANRALDRLSATPTPDLSRAETLAAQAVAAAPRSPHAHYARAEVLRVQRRHEEAILEYQTAIAADRNWADAIAGLGWCKFWSGEIEETISLHEQAIRLSPRDPNIGYWHFRIGLVHLLQLRLDEAISSLERAAGIAPGLSFVHSTLAAACALAGKPDRAATELAEARRLRGDGTLSSIALLKSAGGVPVGYYGPPELAALFDRAFFAGLRKAGVPEE